MLKHIGKSVAVLVGVCSLATAAFANGAKVKWEPLGLSGGGSMYRLAYSPADPKLMMINSDMSCAFLSHDGGHTWNMINAEQLRSNTGCTPAFHPTDANVIFAAHGGLRVSRDKGVTWKLIDGTPKDMCGDIAIDPGHPDRMMIGDAEGVLSSNDGGKTWAKCKGPTGTAISFHFDQTSPAANRIIYAATTSGIWKSKDGAKTWSQLPAAVAGRKVLAFTGGSNAKEKVVCLYCSVEAKADGGKYTGGVFRSTDGGATWESLMHGAINQDIKKFDEYGMDDVARYQYVLTTNVNPRIVYAVNYSTGIKPPHHSTFWRSDDGGDTWRYVFQPDPRYDNYNAGKDYWVTAKKMYFMDYPKGVAIDPNNPDRIIRSSSNLLVSDDGGKSWWYGNSQPAGELDGKATWNCTGLVVTSTWNFYIDPTEPTSRYICYTDIGFAISRDSDKSWSWWGKGECPNGWANTTYELCFDPKVPGKVWGAFSGTHDIPNANIVQGNAKDTGPGGVAVSTDHCNTWTKSNDGLPNKGVVSVVMDPKSPVGSRTLYCTVWHNGVYKSVDDGKNWTKASDGLGDPEHQEYMYPCKLQLHEDGTLFVLLTGRKVDGKYYIDKGPGIYKSTDGAKTWQLVNKGADNYFYWPKDFTVDPRNSNIIYVGVCDAREAHQGGLYRTTDGGKTWPLLCRKEVQHFGAYLHPHRPGWIYMTLCENSEGYGLWLSKDNGKTFEPIKDMPFGNTQRVYVDPSDDNVIYVSTFGGSVWRGPAE
jgi:photosystem II stability/assembly factor-like uncharacterized protein